MTGGPLTEAGQRSRRAWFRERWEHGVRFNRLCRMRVLRWDDGGVEMALPYAEVLSAHDGVFHGGVVSALIDTAGGGAVMAGHDFDKGSRVSTVSLSVQYLTPARGPELVAYAHCVKRGGRIHYAEVEVQDVEGTACARGQVVVSISGERAGVGEPIAAQPADQARPVS
ncbi:uncharacterized protein (TIGR00369 family) [Streptomyces sp. 846.5]|nr:PaaI family thioesterase [Streptomyces sp. 846.5]TDU01785.1 uncharacterized protein (TIGR00369 family) [Streptomyces sp. 846.5]